MDMAVFDFLTGNMDRHHYETFKLVLVGLSRMCALGRFHVLGMATNAIGLFPHTWLCWLPAAGTLRCAAAALRMRPVCA